MLFVKFACMALGIVFLIPSLAFAEGCPNPTPRDSQIWRDFEKVTDAEYPQLKKSVESPDENLRWVVWGHALGRLASAVQSQPDRRDAFECVLLAIQQIIVSNYISDTDQGAFFSDW